MNHLVEWHLARFDIANGGSLPGAVSALSGTGTTINLAAGYGGLGTEVWYVGDLQGT